MAFIVKAQTSVYISAAVNENIGERLIYNIKEEIRRSSSIKLTSLEESFIQVHFVSMDYDNKGYSIIYSLVITWGAKQKFYKHYVGVCGNYVVNEVAEELVAYIDKACE